MAHVETSSDELVALVGSLSNVHMDEYAVVGSYMRFGEQVREQLKDARVRIAEACSQPAKRRDNHLLWAAPGSGKTYFVEQVAASLPDVSYAELNLAKLAEADFRESLAQAIAAGPTVCLIDEVDAKPEEPWPYEALMPFLDVNLERGGGIVFVLAGSSGSTIHEFKERIRARPKGTDVLSRVPEANGWEIAPMDAGDRILVALSQMLNAADELGRAISGVEKLALHYLAQAPHLANARQLREFSVRAVERGSASNDRIRYDDLFDSGDPENKSYWASVMPKAEALVSSFVRIRDGARGAPGRVRTDEPKAHLPVPPTPFLGRERELAEVVALLARDDARLVTLTGPGGTGKTRLAIEAAANLLPSYKAGVFWVGLASLRDPTLVTETIAQTLGAKDGLAEHISERELLLLLDNLEQVIECAVELSRLLQSCPNLTLLITSRELLRIQGEVEYSVPPLAEPEAVTLFCERSQLDPSDEIAELCKRLDSLPLAVELAAARTTVLSPAEILERLSSRLDLLKGGRDADPRQQTLRATIEWSYDLLTEPDRRLFARLSVFAGGCTLDAAEEIVRADVDGLQSLVDKSLVRRSAGRFWMLETIGELAREHFDASSEAEAIGRRHAQWFLGAAERAEPFLKGAEQSAWLQRLEEDHDNLRESIAWLLDHGESERAGRLAAALWLFWWMHGHFSEARRWLQRALEAGSDEPSETRAKLLDGAGYLAFEQSDDEAVGLLEASLSCAREVGATSTTAFAAAHLGGVLAWAGRGGSDAQAALAVGDEAVRLARQAGDDYVLAVALNNLGAIHDLRGDTERAAAYLEESLELRRRLGDMSGLALSLYNLADGALRKGDAGRAAALYSEAAEIASAIGDKRHLCFAYGGLASVAHRERRWEDAETHARASLRLAKELGDKRAMAEAIFCLAGIAAATGDPARAARLAAAAELHHSRVTPDGITLDDEVRASVETAKAASDPGIWQRGWAAGRAMSLDDAAAQAASVSIESSRSGDRTV